MYLLVCDKCGTELTKSDYYSLEVNGYTAIGQLFDGRTIHLCKNCYKDFVKNMIK